MTFLQPFLRKADAITCPYHISPLISTSPVRCAPSCCKRTPQGHATGPTVPGTRVHPASLPPSVVRTYCFAIPQKRGRPIQRVSLPRCDPADARRASVVLSTATTNERFWLLVLSKKQSGIRVNSAPEHLRCRSSPLRQLAFRCRTRALDLLWFTSVVLLSPVRPPLPRATVAVRVCTQPPPLV